MGRRVSDAVNFISLLTVCRILVLLTCRLSILGLTDHLVHQRISAELYKKWFLEHKALVSKPFAL